MFPPREPGDEKSCCKQSPCSAGCAADRIQAAAALGRLFRSPQRPWFMSYLISFSSSCQAERVGGLKGHPRAAALSDICIFLIPGCPQNLLLWAGHHRDVREEHGALWRVLESRAGDVAPGVQLQHGDNRCNQCTSCRSAFPVVPHGLSLAATCLHRVGRDSPKIKLVSAEANTGGGFVGVSGQRCLPVQLVGV